MSKSILVFAGANDKGVYAAKIKEYIMKHMQKRNVLVRTIPKLKIASNLIENG